MTYQELLSIQKPLFLNHEYELEMQKDEQLNSYLIGMLLRNKLLFGLENKCEIFFHHQFYKHLFICKIGM